MGCYEDCYDFLKKELLEDIELYCSECGESLEADIKKGTLVVIPCDCQYDIGFEDGVADADERVDAAQIECTEREDDAYEDGYENGYDRGYENGHEDGDEYGYDRGYDKGYEDGYNYGYEVGYRTAYDGYNSGESAE